jgi:hypothetical protein
LAFSYRPLNQRIADCIRTFDHHAAQGRCPKDWRSQVKLADVRFGNIYDSFPAKVFGDLDRARALGGFKWSMTFYDKGCLADKKNSTTVLRAAWSEALKTDPVWTKFNNRFYRRMIKGVIVEVFENSPGHWEMFLTRSGKSDKLSTKYKNIASAMRAARKLASKI